MLAFRDINGQELLGQALITRRRGVNGEQSLTGVIQDESAVINQLDKRWQVDFEGETYVITYAKPVDNGGRKYLEFDAIHHFFDIFRNEVLYSETSGSHTFKWYMEMLFKNTGYTYVNQTKAAALEIDNFGMKNKLSLFNDVVGKAGVEFVINQRVVTIKERIGSDLSTLVRKGFNLKEFTLEHDFSGFSTYMEGFGAFKDEENPSKGRLHVQYTSPLAKTYGKLHAEPKVDERFTNEKTLLADIKKTVDQSLSVSLTLSIQDLQAAGYPYAMANVGDYVMVIDELMAFEQTVRIVEVTDYFDAEGAKINEDVTAGDLSLARKAEAANAANDKQLADIIAGKNKLPTQWLENLIANATGALTETMSELKFTPNGILAIQKNNKNNVVLFSSAGVGLSRDGGKSFRTAITSAGVVADGLIAGTTIKGITIEGAHFKGSDMTLDNWLTIQNDNKGIRGNYDYNDGPRDIWPRRYMGNYQLGRRFLSFYADTILLTVDGKESSVKEYTESFYGPNNFKLRSYKSKNGPLSTRTDIVAGQIQLSQSWTGREKVTLGFDSGKSFVSARNLYDVNNIASRSGLDLHLQCSKLAGNVYPTIHIGTDAAGGRFYSNFMYQRTYSGAPNMYITSAGTVGRSTSASRYKLNIETVNKERKGLLNLREKSWFDKSNTEAYAEALTKESACDSDGVKKIHGEFDFEKYGVDIQPLQRHFGLLAEDLVACGLENYVSYDVNGNVEGIAYDRLTVPLIGIVRDQQKEMMSLSERIERLEERCKADDSIV